jgi:predicted peptidase
MEQKTPFPTRPGIHEALLPATGQRYSISIPPSFQIHRATPLILALHYAGHGSPYYGKPMITELVGPALEELGALIAAPDCTATDWVQPESESDILKLLDAIHANYPIDSQRTLITGYSMGGLGVWHYAARYPERFRAAVVMAGIPPENALEIDWRIPLYVIHSHQDELMPIQPILNVLPRLQAKGVSIEFLPLNGITHFETYRFVQPLHSTVSWIEEIWGNV